MTVMAGLQGFPRNLASCSGWAGRLRCLQRWKKVCRKADRATHDFSNLLTAIIGYSEIALERLHPESDLHREIFEIQKAARSAVALNRDLFASTRGQPPLFQSVDLNAVIYSRIEAGRTMMGSRFEFVADLEDDLPPGKADPEQIDEFLITVALAAESLLPNGARILIATSRLDAQAAEGAGVAMNITVKPLSFAEGADCFEAASSEEARREILELEGIFRSGGENVRSELLPDGGFSVLVHFRCAMEK